jgi:hypothetical protein
MLIDHLHQNNLTIDRKKEVDKWCSMVYVFEFSNVMKCQNDLTSWNVININYVQCYVRSTHKSKQLNDPNFISTKNIIPTE